MNLSSLFNIRNYKYLYYLAKPYDKGVVASPLKYENFDSLDAISNYFKIKDFSKIIVVASGPSSKNVVLEDEAIYFCCNDSINIVCSKPFVYIVHDEFYLVKYLKSFSKYYHNWKGTIFWLVNNGSASNKKSFERVRTFLGKRSRNRREFLITDYEYSTGSQKVFNEISQILNENFKFEFKSINSGFNILVFASVLSFLNDLPLEVYGLDMGEGGEGYFNKDAKLGKSIKGENNKNIVRDFLSKVYGTKLKIKNFSNFMKYE